ncbi:alpha/beta fold hydrolase [Curvibacter sp. CHRR-16]|uniref:YheT family hydrolase n=1 Tax=Curvibacter sp. CHRR-16 TaxID=2835872 RepID=UPI002023A3DE|nr:alpha/beta fold hydrolase [Curvibacter sp. CHRR-16]
MRQRWTTPDNDFVDADWQWHHEADAPTVVLFHGLEGSSSSHYAHALAAAVQARGWNLVVPHFRGCSGELNHAPRAYHSGDYEEIDWMLQQVRSRVYGPILGIGVSLGGNALLRWAQECSTSPLLHAVVALCAPLDLTAASHQLAHGVNRWIYTRHFLRTMVPKGLRKALQFPGLLNEQQLNSARDLRDFDAAFTAPLHGFSSAAQYWVVCSAGRYMRRIQHAALVVNTANDPLVPVSSLPAPAEVPTHVAMWRPLTGGHVGFSDPRWPAQMQGVATAIMEWLKQHV